MPNILTEDLLGIYWKGEETAGILFYGYWKGKSNIEPDFPVKICPAETEFSKFHLYGDYWDVWLWEIPIVAWPEPSQWKELLKETLKSIQNESARIAWCGIEGHFADPPFLFDPKEMTGGVYAVLTKEFGFKCTAYIGQPFRAITDDEMLKLKSLI